MTARRPRRAPPSAPKPARRLPDPLADLTAKPRFAEPFVDAALTPKAHAKYLRSYARRQAAKAAPRSSFTAPLLLERYCRRYAIVQESITDRDYLELFRACDLAAAALNAWQARRNGSQP